MSNQIPRLGTEPDSPSDDDQTQNEQSQGEQGDDTQVSEVGNLAGEAEEIYPDQATAGYPDTESGDAEEGTAGPNARPRDDREGGGPDNPH